MRIGVDIGGTFTDVVAALTSGQLITAKTPSTPDDPSVGVLNGLTVLAERMGMELAELLRATQLMIHGTTVATNCLAERKGAHVGLLTTQGFRDILELRDGTKTDRYDLHSPFPQPLISRPDRCEVAERIRWDGSVDISLHEPEVRKRLERLRQRGVQALVVGFLHSHVNPAHELCVRDLIRSMDWDVYTVLSHDILCVEGEYDRFSTAAVNAYVGPRLSTYLARLEQRLQEHGATFPLMIMQSTGGLLPVSESSRYAVGCVTSGPAGGAMASAFFAQLGNMEQVVAYDTGGTTTDISLLESGSPAERRQTTLKDIKIAIPSIDIEVVPLGGGSIARIDAGGILTLGPDSAAADPGPACYGRGGSVATLTDANLVLGYLSAQTFLGGRMPLRRDLAEQAVRHSIADPLGISVEQASLAVHILASSRIAESLRAVTLRHGLDPRDLALLSFGGAGGVHTVQVARELSVRRALVPREASVFSALGFLSADVRLDGQRTLGRSLHHVTTSDLVDIFNQIERDMRARMKACGFDDANTRITRHLGCRYERQISALEIAVPDDLAELDVQAWLQTPFEARYRQYYGHVHESEPPYIESCRISAFGRVAGDNQVCPTDHGPGQLPRPAGFSTTRRIFDGEWKEVPAYWFDELRSHTELTGPAVIESATTSVIMPVGCRGHIDTFGSLCIQEEA